MAILYRVLKPNENPTFGLAADDPTANFTVFQHVRYGSLKTQYISTCKSLEAVMDFAEKGKPFAAEHGNTGTRKIVEIDVTSLLKEVPGCIIIDLTNPVVLEQHIPFSLDQNVQTAIRFAKQFEEVLVQPIIMPPPIPDPVTGQLIQPSPLPCRIPGYCMNEIGCV